MDGIEPWHVWLIAGLLLGAFEMLVPGVYLMWLALAALATALIAFVSAPALAVQVVAFVSLSLIFAFSARRMLRDRPIVSSDPLMNQRGARLLGQTAVVTQAIVDGAGRARVGDGEWIARGPDAPAGTPMRIAAVSGAELTLEPVGLPAPAQPDA